MTPAVLWLMVVLNGGGLDIAPGLTQAECSN
jgi:hypothetical protein